MEKTITAIAALLGWAVGMITKNFWAAVFLAGCTGLAGYFGQQMGKFLHLKAKEKIKSIKIKFKK